jgi:hypothetical protein
MEAFCPPRECVLDRAGLSRAHAMAICRTCAPMKPGRLRQAAIADGTDAYVTDLAASGAAFTTMRADGKQWQISFAGYVTRGRSSRVGSGKGATTDTRGSAVRGLSHGVSVLRGSRSAAVRRGSSHPASAFAQGILATDARADSQPAGVVSRRVGGRTRFQGPGPGARLAKALRSRREVGCRCGLRTSVPAAPPADREAAGWRLDKNSARSESNPVRDQRFE